jgi:hypothetical protein
VLRRRDEQNLPGGDRGQSFRLQLEIDGFFEGAKNTIEFQGYGDSFAPGLVGSDILSGA